MPRLVFFTLFVCLLFLSACEITADISVDPIDEVLLGEWVWLSAELASGETVTPYSSPTFRPMITFSADPQDIQDDSFDDAYLYAGGNLGCNNFGGGYRLVRNNQIEITGAFRNEARCGPERMDPEIIWFEQSVQIESYTVVDNRLTFKTAEEDTFVFTRADQQSNSTGIYTDIINDWGRGSADSYLVIEQPTFNQDRITLEETRQQLEGMSMPIFSEGLTDELWSAFAAAQEQPALPADFLATGLPLISQADYESYFASGDLVGWEALAADYPGVRTIYSFSNIGITDENALVYYGVHTHDFEGGYVTLRSQSQGLYRANSTSSLWSRNENGVENSFSPTRPANAPEAPYP